MIRPSSSWNGITRLRFPVDMLLRTQSNSVGSMSLRRRCRRCSTVAGSSSSSATARLCITSATALIGSVAASTCPSRVRSASASAAVTARSMTLFSLTSWVSSVRSSPPATVACQFMWANAVPLPETLGRVVAFASVFLRFSSFPEDIRSSTGGSSREFSTDERDTLDRGGYGTASRSNPSCHSIATPFELRSGSHESPSLFGKSRRNATCRSATASTRIWRKASLVATPLAPPLIPLLTSGKSTRTRVGSDAARPSSSLAPGLTERDRVPGRKASMARRVSRVHRRLVTSSTPAQSSSVLPLLPRLRMNWWTC